ncbi:MAG: SecY family transport protein [Bacilli bacterium]|nr:SecY family transport protein [Bacilli bacterium]
MFASSILTAPTIIMNFIGVSRANPIYAILSISSTYKGVPFGLIIYVLLIIAFTYVYTFLQVDPDKISENFQKSGAYIPGVRPGEETAKYIRKILIRVTTFGAIFLTVIAATPMLLTMYFDLPSSIAFGGTGLIIVVGVILELSREIDGRLAAKEYQGFVIK